jgi:lipopolysaccharide/colanic/teichoic acid biosynthesis glycosyltransferase|tara:strand:+ start:101 stop:766 length:666 start_codon:yes stop_codon:yes gene_type:complete
VYNSIKRIFDILVSFVSILLLIPLFIPIMLILKLTGEGEIFYFQERVGLNNKTIKIFKFATMLKNSEQMGSGIYTAKNDPRILPFGNFLRKTKINELPQIINILNGDISLVGPRPLIRKTFELYNDEEQKIIFSMKPGLTGIGSIVFRNEEEILNNANMDLEEFYEKYITPYKAQLELWYKKNQSFLCDLQIIFLTSWAILFKESRLPWIIFKDLPNQREI